MNRKLGLTTLTALILAASTALAGIVFLPVGSIYTDPELAPVRIQGNGAGSVNIRTTGLTGELTLDASDVPDPFEAPEVGCARLPFEQTLTLAINLSKGVAEGRSRGRIQLAPGEVVNFDAEAQGKASCVRRNGRQCGQIIVDLELRGTLSDPDDPTRVGLVRLQTLGSLVRDGASGSWVALSANAQLGLPPGLVVLSLISMTEGETCGI